jgi:prepilin-type N-terminal cleavage/methylation domain-containing protein
MRTKNTFSLIELMIVIAIIGLFAAFSIPRAQAQPSGTNIVAQFGAALPNASAANYYQALIVQRFQQNNGIYSGTIAPNVNLAPTNTFPTSGYIYTQPPIVTATTSSNTTVNVTSVTTTNFILTTSQTNVTVYWQAVGH